MAVGRPEGLTLLAQPGGRSPATPFRAVELGDSRVVFENPEHDFPQRITYRLDGGVLKTRVEALQDGEWQEFGDDLAATIPARRLIPTWRTAGRRRDQPRAPFRRCR